MVKRVLIKKKKNNFFREQYCLCWNYLRLSRNFVYFAVGIFFIFSLVGFFVPAPGFLSKMILEFIEELLKQTEGMSQLELIVFIFLNNIQASFFGMILGIFFGFFSILIAMSNGYLLGFVGIASVKEAGFLSLLNLLPHGIFELPAIFICLGLGIKLGSFIFQKNKLDSFKNFLMNSLRIFLFIVVPLLIVAAIIEGGLIFLLR